MVSEKRYQAYLDAMKSHNLPVEEDMVAHGYYVADSAKYHVPNFLAAGATAILCGNDLIASGVITECRLRGFSVPDDELLARIKRITKKLDKTMAMNFGDISIDFDKKQVCKNGNPIVLTALEYRLFAMLAKNSGKVLTREQILERIWDLSGNYVEDNTLTVYIKRLRKKLDTNMIKTVKGLGYRLEV